MLRTAKVTPDDFRQALDGRTASRTSPRVCVGLWWDAKGDCQQAHESMQDEGRAAGHASAPGGHDHFCMDRHCLRTRSIL